MFLAIYFVVGSKHQHEFLFSLFSLVCIIEIVCTLSGNLVRKKVVLLEFPLNIVESHSAWESCLSCSDSRKQLQWSNLFFQPTKLYNAAQSWQYVSFPPSLFFSPGFLTHSLTRNLFLLKLPLNRMSLREGEKFVSLPSSFFKQEKNLLKAATPPSTIGTTNTSYLLSGTFHSKDKLATFSTVFLSYLPFFQSSFSLFRFLSRFLFSFLFSRPFIYVGNRSLHFAIIKFTFSPSLRGPELNRPLFSSST